MDTLMVVVTVVSLIVAATMSLVAWRTVRDERRRSDARVAALAAEIHAQDLPLGASDRLADTTPLFTAAPTMPARSGLTVVAMLGALVVGTAVALAVLFTGAGTGPSAAADSRPHDRVAAAAHAGPLELVALGHERDADGLTVRGIVRNPASGGEIHELSAVVLLFDRNGGLVGTGRAPVQATTLSPGGETTFVVSVPNAPGVDRYRVSFRTVDQVLPHVDVRS